LSCIISVTIASAAFCDCQQSALAVLRPGMRVRVWLVWYISTAKQDIYERLCH